MSSRSVHVPYRRPLLLLGTVLSSLALRAWAQDRARLLTAQEFKSVHSKLVPALVPLLRSPLEPDSRQAFLIPGQDGHSLRMVPVRYDAFTPAAGNTTFRCGIFLLPDIGATTFVPTMGYGSTEMEFCASLVAIGFMPSPGHAFPRLLMVYSGGTGHDQTQEPLVLDYANAKNTYVPNDDLSERIANLPGKPTVAWIKSAIAKIEAHQ